MENSKVNILDTYNTMVHRLRDRAFFIGISGLKGAGKTTLAKALGAEYSSKYEVVYESFSTPVKAVAAQFLDYIGEDFLRVNLNGGENRNRPFSDLEKEDIRVIYQVIGHTLGREGLFEDIWIKLLLERCRLSFQSLEGSGKPVIVIIDDVRYGNELEMINDLLGLHIYLDSNIDQSSHPSEQAPELLQGDHNSNHLMLKLHRSMELDWFKVPVAMALVDRLLKYYHKQNTEGFTKHRIDGKLVSFPEVENV